MMIKEQLEEVRERVNAACLRAGRDPKSVTLIAVSKTKPAQAVQEAYEAGARDFGENKVQEILQNRLADHLVHLVALQMADHMPDVDVLLEINVAKEESKYGFFLEDAEEAIRRISALPHVHIKGLMTIAPFVENPEENRGIFQKLYQFSVDINDKNIDNVTMGVLSMGMSGDFEVAIEEGATMVRVGTSIFGAR